jgi:uncharacterized protein (DUF488 family)
VSDQVAEQPPILYTVGYGNRPWAEFLALLPVGVTVIDVRRKPVSRYRHYGLEYLHGWLHARVEWQGALGNAPGGVRWLPANGAAAAGAVLLNLAYRIQHGERLVLLCAEADWRKCHRQFVAAVLAERVPGLRIVHLGDPRPDRGAGEVNAK